MSIDVYYRYNIFINNFIISMVLQLFVNYNSIILFYDENQNVMLTF